MLPCLRKCDVGETTGPPEKETAPEANRSGHSVDDVDGNRKTYSKGYNYAQALRFYHVDRRLIVSPAKPSRRLLRIAFEGFRP